GALHCGGALPALSGLSRLGPRRRGRKGTRRVPEAEGHEGAAQAGIPGNAAAAAEAGEVGVGEVTAAECFATSRTFVQDVRTPDVATRNHPPLRPKPACRQEYAPLPFDEDFR